MKKRRCFICNGQLKFGFLGQDFLYRTTSKKFRVYVCTKCKVEQIMPIPQQSEIETFYSRNYYSYRTAKKDFFIKIREKIIEMAYEKKYNKNGYYYLAYIAKNMFSGIPLHYRGKNRFLDVGCGNDYNIAMLKKFGWVGYGFEIGKKEKRKTVYFDTDICKVDFKKKKFDYIRIWHVIEHVQNPDNFLDKVRSLASPDCTIALGLPNTNSLYAKLFGRFWYNRDIPRHLINYNVQNLTLLLNKHDLKVQKIQYFSGGGFIGSIFHILNYYLHLNLDIRKNMLLILLFLPLDILIMLVRYADTISVLVVPSTIPESTKVKIVKKL